MYTNPSIQKSISALQVTNEIQSNQSPITAIASRAAGNLVASKFAGMAAGPIGLATTAAVSTILGGKKQVSTTNYGMFGPPVPAPQQSTGFWSSIGGAIANLVPGYQPGLGERPTESPGIGKIPIIGDIFSAISRLVPGYQPALGERAPGYMGMTPQAAQALQQAQYNPLLPGPNVPGGLPQIPGLIKSWQTGTTTMYMFQVGNSVRIGCFKRNGQFKSWTPYKPVCLGKRPTPAKAARVAKGLKRFAKRYEKAVEMVGYKVTRR